MPIWKIEIHLDEYWTTDKVYEALRGNCFGSKHITVIQPSIIKKWNESGELYYSI